MVTELPSQYGMAERELSKIQQQMEENLRRLKTTTDPKERQALLRYMRSLLAQAEGQLEPPADAP
jgi:hypothetical protein